MSISVTITADTFYIESSPCFAGSSLVSFSIIFTCYYLGGLPTDLDWSNTVYLNLFNILSWSCSNFYSPSSGNINFKGFSDYAVYYDIFTSKSLKVSEFWSFGSKFESFFC